MPMWRLCFFDFFLLWSCLSFLPSPLLPSQYLINSPSLISSHLIFLRYFRHSCAGAAPIHHRAASEITRRRRWRGTVRLNRIGDHQWCATSSSSFSTSTSTSSSFSSSSCSSHFLSLPLTFFPFLFSSLHTSFMSSNSLYLFLFPSPPLPSSAFLRLPCQVRDRAAILLKAFATHTDEADLKCFFDEPMPM